MRKTALLTLALLVGMFATSTVIAGPKWEIGNSNTWLSAGFLGQVHFASLDGAADEDDIYLRRARIILSGQITDGIMFFAETDNDNAGKSGQAAVSTDIQDAFVDFRLLQLENGSALWMETGLILLPFSFENLSSAASLVGLDFNTEVVKFVNTFAWRDYGAEFHGNAGKRIAFAAGVFDGYDVKDSDKNPNSAMRFTGHLIVNLIGDAEKGWFLSQERLGKKGSYLAVGAGFDIQDKATLTITPATNGIPEKRTENDSDNWVVDMQSGWVLDPVSLTLNAAWYEWENSSFHGNTAFAEGGILFQDNQLTMKYSLQDPDNKADTADYTVGIHRFLKGHNARGGIEYRWGDSADMILAGVQILL